MGDSDAEWIGVDFEFPKANPRTTARPAVTRRPFTERPVPRVTSTVGPHDAPEVVGPTNPTENPYTLTLVSAVVGGVLGLALMSLLIYMLVLRRRLNKAKVAKDDSQYQLRVEDVAHLTHLDETSNTYVNTTDLQKLLSSVRAKKKADEPPPTLPKIQHQTPTPYRSVPDPKSHSTKNQSDNKGFTCDPDIVVVRAPMPIPHGKTDLEETCNQNTKWQQPKAVQETEGLYSNIEPAEPFKLAKPPSRRKVGVPSAAPPPPPANQKKKTTTDNTAEENAPLSQTVIARPAPPPPSLGRTKSVEAIEPPKVQKPLIPGGFKPTPPVAPKPNKNSQTTDTNPAPPAASKSAPPPPSKPIPPPTNKPTPPTFKPAPPVASKPGVFNKGKGLPPLKMALLPSLSKSSLNSCSTPDTGIIELTPENTPTPNTGSISSKIAFLEGKMKTPVLPTRALPQKT